MAAPVRPQHLTPAEQNQFLYNALGYTFGVHYTKVQRLPPFSNLDSIDIYDPPLVVDGVIKVYRLTLEIMKKWENVFKNSSFDCCDFTYCILELDALEYLLSFNTARRINTTIPLRVPFSDDPREPHQFKEIYSHVVVQRNPYYKRDASTEILVRGISIFYHSPERSEGNYPPLPPEWTDWKRLGTRGKVELVHKKAIQTLPAPTTVQAPKKSGFNFKSLLGKAPANTKTEIEKTKNGTPLAFDQKKLIHYLSKILHVQEDTLKNAQNLESCVMWEGRYENGVPVHMEIDTYALLTCIIPLAKLTRTNILDFSFCILEKNAIADLMYHYDALDLQRIQIQGSLTEDEGISIDLHKDLILQRCPHFQSHFELIYYVRNPYWNIVRETVRQAWQQKIVGSPSKDPSALLLKYEHKGTDYEGVLVGAQPQAISPPMPLMHLIKPETYKELSEKAQAKVIWAFEETIRFPLDLKRDDWLNRPKDKATAFLRKHNNNPLQGPIRVPFCIAGADEFELAFSLQHTCRIDKEGFSRILQPLLNAYPNMDKLDLSLFDFEVENLVAFLKANPKIRILNVNFSWEQDEEKWQPFLTAIQQLPNPPKLQDFEILPSFKMNPVEIAVDIVLTETLGRLVLK